MRNQELFNHMSREHGLTLLESEMHEIELIVARTLANDRVQEAARSSQGFVPCSEWVGTDLIRAERERQIGGEGWDGGHDDGHRSGELCDAAISYAKAAAKQARGESLEYLKGMAAACVVPWPWEDGWWKPDADQVRNLVKAGALIAAEIDRLNRERRKVPTVRTQRQDPPE